MPRPETRHRAFTIIEMLVVIGIIALLVGLLAPALSGVQKRSRKSQEINHIRSAGQGWTMYANNNDDRALPGYIEPDVQTEWKMTPLFPDRTLMPPEVAAPWTWRMMSYVGNNADLIHGYLHDEDSLLDLLDEADEVALTPRFAYNSLYVGGWWEMAQMPAGGDRPQPRYWDARDFDDPSRKLTVTVRSIAQIRRSTEIVVFCSAAAREPGIYKKPYDDAEPGSHFVNAPIEGNVINWGRVRSAGGSSGSAHGPAAGTAKGDTSVLEAFISTAMPIGRYTGQVAVIYPDGHTDVQTPGALADQQKFIDIANEREFRFDPGAGGP